MAWLHHHCLALHLLVASDTDVAQFLYLFSDGTQLNHSNLPEVATLGLHHFISISHVPRSAWVSLEGGEVPIMRGLSKNDYGVQGVECCGLNKNGSYRLIYLNQE